MCFSAVGSIALSGVLAGTGAAAMVAGHRIQYVHEASTLGRYTLLVYAVAAVLPFFVSTTKLVRTIGTTFVVALVVTMVLYREALTSVWCFFAAILSGLILVAVLQGQRDDSGRQVAG